LPSPYEIQVALADAIRAATTNAVVIPRNILGEMINGNYAMLQSEPDGNRIHGWFVSQSQDVMSQAFQGYAEYDAQFLVWQIYEYQTGSDADNSEMRFAAERELVKIALSAVLAPPLDSIDPPTFYEIALFPKVGENRKPIHMAKSTVTAKGIKTLC
jgi:hypothetical protein